MGFTIYQSCDAGAPTLTGEVGSLVALLDAVLVNGYGSKTSAGWTKPYTGTNKAVFRQGANSCGYYLRVQDDAPGIGGAREARVTGYEAMTSVDAGSGVFPLATTQTVLSVNAFSVHKSDVASAVEVPWIVFADSQTFYLFSTNPIPVLGYNQTQFGFGDFLSLTGGTADPGRCFLAACDRENVTIVSQDYMNPFGMLVAAWTGWTKTPGSFFPAGPRPVGSLGGSTPLAVYGDFMRLQDASGNAAGRTYIKLDGNPMIWMVPLMVGDAATKSIRGRFRGLYHWLHPAEKTVGTGDVFGGIGETAGKQFCGIALSTTSTAVVEISDTLEVNR